MSSRRTRAGLVAAFLLTSGLVAPLAGMPSSSADDETTGTVDVEVAATTPGAPNIGPPRAGNRSAVANWTEPTDDRGAPITGYDIRAYRGDELVDAISVPASDRSATVTGLTAGVAYTLDVTARRADGTGAPSARSTEVVPIGTPGAPTIGAATSSDEAAVIRWAGPASNGGAPVTGYVIRVYSGKTLVKTVNANAVARRSTITGLTGGVTYTLTVSAKNSKGVGTPSARSAAVTPGTA